MKKPVVAVWSGIVAVTLVASLTAATLVFADTSSTKDLVPGGEIALASTHSPAAGHSYTCTVENKSHPYKTTITYGNPPCAQAVLTSDDDAFTNSYAYDAEPQEVITEWSAEWVDEQGDPRGNAGQEPICVPQTEDSSVPPGSMPRSLWGEYAFGTQRMARFEAHVQALGAGKSRITYRVENDGERPITFLWSVAQTLECPEGWQGSVNAGGSVELVVTLKDSVSAVLGTATVMPEGESQVVLTAPAFVFDAYKDD